MERVPKQQKLSALPMTVKNTPLEDSGVGRTSFKDVKTTLVPKKPSRKNVVQTLVVKTRESRTAGGLEYLEIGIRSATPAVLADDDVIELSYDGKVN